MKVKYLVQDEFVTKDKVYDVIELLEPLCQEDEPCVEVMSDGLNDFEPIAVYLRLYTDNPEYEVVE